MIGKKRLNGVARGFTTETTNIGNKPPKTVVFTPDLIDVTKGIISEETQISSTRKMTSLYVLRDCIYWNRTKDFQWDLDSIVELIPLQAIWSMTIEIDRSYIETAPVTQPQIAFGYLVSTFSVINPAESSDYCSLWIKKIHCTTSDDVCVICPLTVDWNEFVSSKRSLFTGKYRSSYICARRGIIWSGWNDIITYDAVTESFHYLTQSRSLPCAVRNLERENDAIRDRD